MSQGHDGHSHEAAPKSIALNPDAKGNLETTLRVAGMDCADEIAALEQVFRPLKGVREVRVNLVGGKVTLLHDESVTPEQLIGAVASTGMKAARDGMRLNRMNHLFSPRIGSAPASCSDMPQHGWQTVQ